MAIDEFMLDKSTELLANYNHYINNFLSHHPEVHLTRHEEWLNQLLAYSGLSPPLELRTEIAEEARSIQLKDEEKMDYNRKGRPGDHREELQPSTVDEMNEVLGYILDRFGYVRSLAAGFGCEIHHPNFVKHPDHKLFTVPCFYQKMVVKE